MSFITISMCFNTDCLSLYQSTKLKYLRLWPEFWLLFVLNVVFSFNWFIYIFMYLFCSLLLRLFTMKKYTLFLGTSCSLPPCANFSYCFENMSVYIGLCSALKTGGFLFAMFDTCPVSVLNSVLQM